MNDLEKTDLDEIGLDDPEEISYYFNDKQLILVIKN